MAEHKNIPGRKVPMDNLVRRKRNVVFWNMRLNLIDLKLPF